MTRSLVQALEGISFPCDRSRLMEYARTNDAAARALESLAAIPERQYRDMTEVLSAVPSKTGKRPRPEEAPEAKPDFGITAPALPDMMATPYWALGWEWTQTYLRLAQRLWHPWMR